MYKTAYASTYPSTTSLKLYFMSYLCPTSNIFSPRRTSCLWWSVGRSMVSAWLPWAGCLRLDLALRSEPVKTTQQSTPSGDITLQNCKDRCSSSIVLTWAQHIICGMTMLLAQTKTKQPHQSTPSGTRMATSNGPLCSSHVSMEHLSFRMMFRGPCGKTGDRQTK